MFSQVWLLLVPLVLAASSVASPRPTAQSRSNHPPVTSPSVVPVYHANRNRGISDDPFPVTSPTAGSRSALRESSTGITEDLQGQQEQEPANVGFVEPIDFSAFLKEVGTNKHLSASHNPLFASESQDNYSGYFGPDNRRDPFLTGSFNEAAAAPSDDARKSNEDNAGFVDPNVQFRSLFDASPSATGFKPEDFLGYQDESSGVEPSKGSQTQTFPQFTYSGRQEDDEDYNRPPFRSSYRQVENSPGGRGDRDDYDDGRQASPYNYDDVTEGYFRDSERDRPPAPSAPRYQGGGGRGYGPPPPRGPPSTQGGFTPSPEATAHAPLASGNKPTKTAAAAPSSSGKDGRCKKVQKQVDYNEDYSEYVDPDPQYDPSSYQSRYKRQARGGQRGRQSKNKRPMTCYVCEDDQGRYAERCSFDSNGDPKQGTYFHSSSSSFTDNGNNRRPGGGSGSRRQRRNSNPIRPPGVVVSSTTVKSLLPQVSATEEPKKVEKRQSANGNPGGPPGGPGRFNPHPPGHPGNPHRPGHSGGGPGRFQPSLGAPQQQQRYASNFGGPEYGRAAQRRQDQGPRRDENYFDFGNEPQGFRDTHGPPHGYGSLDIESAPQRGRGEGNRDRDEYPDYSYDEPPQHRPNDGPGPGGPPPGGRRGGGSGNNRGLDFGLPNDFGPEPAHASQNFGFNFNIPRDFDPDYQIGRDPRDRQPILESSPSENSNTFGGVNAFDIGYEDYVKQFFPEVFDAPNTYTPRRESSPIYEYGSDDEPRQGGGSSGSSGHSRQSSPVQYSPGPVYHHRRPDREHTEEVPEYSPPPGYNQGESPAHLERLIGNFGQKDRQGCEKVQKGDMTCFLCRDARGMQKEECMFTSKDPNNQQMAYHEVSQYSSPQANIVPSPHQIHNQKPNSTNNSINRQASESRQVLSTASPPLSHQNPLTSSSTKVSRSIQVVHSSSSKKFHETKKLPVDYDFDY